MVKFQIGDEIDNAMVKGIVHEYSRSKMAFNMFVNSFPRSEKSFRGENLGLNLYRYNAYALFTQHLYEYIVACLKRDRRDTGKIDFEILDNAINLEVEKILRLKRLTIDNKYAPQWENDRNYYEVSCPENFGSDFRQVRNSLGHVDYRRIVSANRILLSEFYINYHKFIMLLFNFAEESWSLDKIEKLDLGDVTDFNVAILKSK